MCVFFFLCFFGSSDVSDNELAEMTRALFDFVKQYSCEEAITFLGNLMYQVSRIFLCEFYFRNKKPQSQRFECADSSYFFDQWLKLMNHASNESRVSCLALVSVYPACGMYLFQSLALRASACKSIIASNFLARPPTEWCESRNEF